MKTIRLRNLGKRAVLLGSVISFIAIAITGRSQPYWDGNFPPYPSANVAFVVAKDGVAYVLDNGHNCGGNYFCNSGAVWRWTKCGGWETIGGFSLDSSVGYDAGQTLYINGNYLYLGGKFDTITYGSQPTVLAATNIAKYNLQTGVWSAVGDGKLSGIVRAIVIDSQGTLYAGQYIDSYEQQAGLDPQTESFKKWTGTSWATVGGGLTFANETCPDGHFIEVPWGVAALAADGTNIYLAGGFKGAPGVESWCVIKWTGSSWVPMGNNCADWYSVYETRIKCMALMGTNLFVAGWFRADSRDYRATTASGLADNGIVRYSTVTGQRLATAKPFLPDYDPDYPYHFALCEGLTVQDGILYFAGDFTGIHDPATDTDVACQRIAKWDGANWTALSTPALDSSPGNGFSDTGNCLAAAGNAIFVTGGFTTPSPLVARWITAIPTTVPSLGCSGPSQINWGDSATFSVYVDSPTTCLKVWFYLGYTAFYPADFSVSGATMVSNTRGYIDIPAATGGASFQIQTNPFEEDSKDVWLVLTPDESYSIIEGSGEAHVHISN